VSTAEHAEVNRRDFLYIATGAVGAVGAVLTAWPFIHQMNPDASVLSVLSVLSVPSALRRPHRQHRWRYTKNRAG